MKTFFILILFSAFVLGGCRSNTHKNEAKTPEKSETPREYKKIENLRFGFVARIPVDWEATDTSDNGDGFVIGLPGTTSGPVDIRLYGTYELMNMGEVGKDTLELFSFSDGTQGKAFKDPHRFVVQRLLGENKYAIFSVKSRNSRWIHDHQKILMTIAESITPVKE